MEGAEATTGQPTCLQVPLGYIANQRCVLRFDNEAGKGDHKHLGEIAARYVFSNLDTLQADFWTEVNKRRKRK